ncbi:hypothetical protein L6164_033261 [Bauhinia variegata]|uniref:Uncharacterized protein n=1 Tax=Bauhinia variegata TaxID=167791 RepID=A0ACB9KRC3_BAUVA|nr:hypothetical protein L6164_033261 [Bauhinia variegata]
MVKGKSTSGRQKIPIEKIPKKSHLQVTFSKRRLGLFKKASELCTLCGVEIGIIVFSPAEKAFSFGHPNVESIIDRFLTRNPAPDSGAHQLVEAHRNANVRDLSMQLTQLQNQFEVEKKRGDDLDQSRKLRQRQFWWESPIDELGLQELQLLKLSMEELKKNVEKQTNKILMEHNSMSSPIVGPNGVRYYDVFEKKPEIKMFSTAPNAYNLHFNHGYL